MEREYSVLMSVYFKEKPEFLKRSIDSMMSQSIAPSEIVIVKDGKLTDELDCLIEQYNNKFPNIFNIVELEKNIGLGLALAEGIKHCKHELIARMDSDDISCKFRCEMQLKEFEKDKDLDVCGDTLSNLQIILIILLLKE